jgi:hypothetical protein
MREAENAGLMRTLARRVLAIEQKQGRQRPK